jgi:hypothetical protein
MGFGRALCACALGRGLQEALWLLLGVWMNDGLIDPVVIGSLGIEPTHAFLSIAAQASDYHVSVHTFLRFCSYRRRFKRPAFAYHRSCSISHSSRTKSDANKSHCLAGWWSCFDTFIYLPSSISCDQKQ